jgi:hypothetical protein
MLHEYREHATPRVTVEVGPHLNRQIEDELSRCISLLRNGYETGG